MAHDPVIGQRADRGIGHGHEVRVGRIDEPGDIRLAEDVDLAADRVAGREHHEFARLADCAGALGLGFDEADGDAGIEVRGVVLGDECDLVLVDHEFWHGQVGRLAAG